MKIKYKIKDIIKISQSHIGGNSDTLIFTKGLSKKDAKQLLQSMESTIEQSVSDKVHELVYDEMWRITDEDARNGHEFIDKNLEINNTSKFYNQ